MSAIVFVVSSGLLLFYVAELIRRIAVSELCLRIDISQVQGRLEEVRREIHALGASIVAQCPQGS